MMSFGYVGWVDQPRPGTWWFAGTMRKGTFAIDSRKEPILVKVSPKGIVSSDEKFYGVDLQWFRGKWKSLIAPISPFVEEEWNKRREARRERAFRLHLDSLQGA